MANDVAREAGTGTRIEGTMPLALRVHNKRNGINWIMYRSIIGVHEAPDGTLLIVFFQGAAPWKGRMMVGKFRLIVRGARLGIISQEIATGRRETLQSGVDTSGEDRAEITTLAFVPFGAEYDD